jgi:hypothetical protein
LETQADHLQKDWDAIHAPYPRLLRPGAAPEIALIHLKKG